jgi:hypothetical protein
MLGEEVSTKIFQQELVYSVKGIPAGIYLVEISGLSDKWKTVKKLIVQ